MVNFEARKDKWGFFGDAIAAHLGNKTSVNGIKIDPTVKLAMLTAGGFYRLGTWTPSDAAGKDRPAVFFDGLLGARYTYLDTRLDIKGFGDVSGDIGYRFSLFSKKNNVRFVAGYRALYQDYSSGSGDNKFKWNVTMYGPVLRLVIEF